MTFSLGYGNARQLSNFEKNSFILAENRLDVEYTIIISKFSAKVQYMFHFILIYKQQS